MSLASSVGLISGLPVDDLIGTYLIAGQRSILNYQDKIDTFQTQQAALLGINNALLDLRTAVENLSSASSFTARSTSSSDESALTVTGSANAPLGSYGIDVLQLATAHRLGAQGFADADETPIALADGSLSFRIGSSGTVETIDVSANMTLSDLRLAINAADAGVTASIINDGSAENPYRLVLTSSETGAANEIIITQNDTSLDFANSVIEAAAAATGNTYAGTATSGGTFTGTESKRFVIEFTTGGALGAAQFRVSTDGGVTFGPDNEFTTGGGPVDIGDGVTIDFSAGDFAVGDRFEIDAFAPEIQVAQDAVLKIDGVILTRDSNSVSDAIDGLELSLLQVTESTANVTVSQDTSAARGRIVTFVEQYNAVISEIAAATAFDAETEIRGPLLGDAGVRGIQRTLANLVTSAVPGLSNSELNSLGSIGITVDSSGELSIDDAKLGDALASDLESVQKIFATVGSPTSSKIEFIGASADTASGTYRVEITQAAEQAYLESLQDITGPLSNSETLTFTIDENTYAVTVAAGSTLDQAIESINSQLSDHGLSITASREGDRLQLATDAYGSDAEITVRSDQSGASGTQLGIGTTDRTDSGQDVVGTIGGMFATGEGQTLTAGSTTDAEGLQILVTATAIGFVGNITVSTGVGAQLETTLDSLTDPDSGVLTSRQKGLSESIEDINTQIEKMQDRLVVQEQRLRSQFASLEVLLAQYSQTATFLTNQLAQLSSLKVSNS